MDFEKSIAEKESLERVAPWLAAFAQKPADASKARLIESQRALSWLAWSLAERLAVARASPSLALAIDSTRRLGAFLGGVEESEREAFLRGERVGAVALSDRGEGPAAKLEKEGDLWRLTCHKPFVANGPIADWIAVFAEADGGEAVALVRSGDPGVRFGVRLDLMGLDGLCVGELEAKGACLAPGRVLGPFADRSASRGYSRETNLTLASAAAGLMHATLGSTLSYAREHRRGDRPLFARQEVAFKLAEVFAATEAAELMCHRAAWGVSARVADADTLVRCAKVFCTENSERAASAAMQLMAGAGYLKGSPAERALRDAKGLLLAGTTVEVARMEIADALLSDF